MSNKNDEAEKKATETSRRDFIKTSGMAIIGVYLLGCDIYPNKQALGFLLLDMKKCQGCLSCMLACSLAHEGVENLSLSRIQVLQNPYGKWPNDITVAQCRQCVEAACVEVCPADALKPDPLVEAPYPFPVEPRHAGTNGETLAICHHTCRDGVYPHRH